MDPPIRRLAIVNSRVPSRDELDGALAQGGEGRRFFGQLAVDDIVLGDPTVCVQCERVTHLLFAVKLRASSHGLRRLRSFAVVDELA